MELLFILRSFLAPGFAFLHIFLAAKLKETRHLDFPQKVEKRSQTGGYFKYIFAKTDVLSLW